MRIWVACLAVCVLGSVLPGSAAADPNSPVTVTVPDPNDGEIYVPAGRPVADLEQAYVEEEYFVSGTATVYTYNWDPNDPNTPPVRGDIVPVDPNVPYTTRIILRRPADPNDFNGTVVIEWFNSTAGFDTSPVWHGSAEYFARKGIVYVGWTNSTTSLGFLVNGCLILGIFPPPQCGTRYAALSMSENGQAFEMGSQIAKLLKSSAVNNPLYPDYPVERVFHSGQSQQGGSMVTYASAFHFPGVNDGYFIQASGSSARRINYRTRCEDPNAPAYPECTPSLQGDDRLVRTDLPVPVYRAHTETDMGGVLSGGSRQTDTTSFRYYEMAGTTHITVHKDIESIPPGVLDPNDPGVFLEDICLYPLNTLADGPILGSFLYNAMWENMELQVRLGTPPPSGDLLEVDPNNELARDSVGNVLGGIRLPQMDVPVASYYPSNEPDPNLPFLVSYLANLFCRLSGIVTPFDAETLAGLYTSNQDYVNQIASRANDLIVARFLLPEDAANFPPQFPFQQTKDQQKCINALNKGLEKVAKTQGKDIAACIKNGSKDKLPEGQTIEQCLVADHKGKVDKARQKLAGAASSNCATPPDFGPTDANTISGAAIQKELDLIHDVFGSDLDAASTILPSSDKAGSKCQAGVTKTIGKCRSAHLKAFNKCKKDGLKSADNWFDEPSDLKLCMGSDPKGKIAKTCNTKLTDTITKKCPSPAVDTDAAFPECAGRDLVECLNESVRCRVCLALNEADAIDRDCDEFDDNASNGSCP